MVRAGGGDVVARKVSDRDSLAVGESGPLPRGLEHGVDIVVSGSVCIEVMRGTFGALRLDAIPLPDQLDFRYRSKC